MTSKIVVNNIEADSGINTITFINEVTAPTFNGNIVGTAATFSGNVDIAGALTYEDVTNVDSVGIVTARSGIHVTGGSVGIGTDNPGNDLEIASSGNGKGLSVTKAGTESAFLGHNGSGNEGLLILREGGTNKIQLYAESNQTSFINTGGNLGIGTAVPATKLNVIGDARVEGFSNAKIQIKRTGNTVANGSIEFLGSDNSFGWGLIANYDAGGSNFNIKEGSNSRLYIKSGNVGIGTDNPTSMFDVEVATNTGINFTSVGSAPIIDFKANSVESAARIRVNEASGGGVLQFATKTTGGTITEGLRIDSSQRLLIGTESSQGKWNNSSGDDHIVQIESTSAYSQSWISHSTSSTAGVQLDIGRSRGSADGHTNLVSNGDLLGHLCFQGADGSQFVRGARISAIVNGTAAADDMPTDLVFETNSGGNNSSERLRITSAGQVNVNQANNNNLLGQLTVFEGTDFNISSQGGRDNIYLISDKSSGYNSYGSSIAWSRVQYADRRAAAIANVQTSTDEDHVGLAFFTHPSADATANIEEKFRITHDGIHITNGVSNFYAAFRLANNGYYYWDIAVPNEGGYGNSFRCECGYNHYYTGSYGAHRSAWISARGTSTNLMFDQDQSHSQSGAWSFSKPNNTTFRVEKSAGSYSGQGYGFIHVRFNYF